jgi:hypothetical protein
MKKVYNEVKCRCIGNMECNICYAGLCNAWDKEYKRYQEIGMEDCLEAKEFMWDYYAQRDKENAEEATDKS